METVLGDCRTENLTPTQCDKCAAFAQVTSQQPLASTVMVRRWQLAGSSVTVHVAPCVFTRTIPVNRPLHLSQRRFPFAWSHCIWTAPARNFNQYHTVS